VGASPTSLILRGLNGYWNNTAYSSLDISTRIYYVGWSKMLILFVCDKYEANGGAHDIVATDVDMNGLDELLSAWHSDRCFWHVYDTEKKEIIKEGSFKPQIKQEQAIDHMAKFDVF
jgi:hypothetical protein